MPTRTLGLLGFSEQDTLLLRSLLTLGEPLLKEKWLIVPFPKAEVILADSAQVKNKELANSPASVVTVGSFSTPPNHLFLRRPLRLSPLVTLLNNLPPTAVPFSTAATTPIQSAPPLRTPNRKLDEISTDAISSSQENNQRNEGGELLNWLRTRLNWTTSSKPSQPSTGSPPPLRISAPSPRNFHNPAVELHENQIRKNLSQLPLFNINFSIPYLIEVLQGLSDEPMAACTRLQLLDLYREPLNTLYHAFGTTVVKKTLTHGNWEGSTTNPGRMFLACADGYKAVILACCQIKNNPLSDECLVIGLWRALEQLAHVLVNSYRYYQSPPSGVFLEAHQIFRYAVYLGSADHSLRCSYPGLNAASTSGPTSIVNLYKQLLLFSISDPYSLPADYFNQALAYIISLAEKVRLLSWHDAERKKLIFDPLQTIPDVVDTSSMEGLFIIDFDTDHPPFPAEKINFSGAIENRWIIDTQPVLDIFYRNTNEILSEAGGLQRRLSEQLTTCLRGAGKRNESRRPEKAKVTLALGILEIHQVLSGKPLPVLGIEKNSWTVINESSNGLMLNSSEQHLVTVGDLVGIQRDSLTENQNWTLGVIRWLRLTATGGMELGLEFLLGIPTSAWCVYPTEDPQPCILQRLTEEESIIAAKGFYRRGINFELHHQAQLRLIKASHLLQDEAGFDQFELGFT